MDHRHRHGHHHVGHVGSGSHRHVTKVPVKKMFNATVAATTEHVTTTTEHMSMEASQVAMEVNHLSTEVGHVVLAVNHTMHEMHEVHGEGHEHGASHAGNHSPMTMSMTHTHKYLSTGSYKDVMIKGINIASVQDLILTLLVVMCLVILIEALNAWLQRHRQRSQYPSFSSKFLVSVLATGVKMTTLTSGYLAMLLVMTMNYWILVAAVVASGIGHLIMRPIVAACCSHGDNTRDQVAHVRMTNCSVDEKMTCRPLCEAANSGATEVLNGHEEEVPLTLESQLDKPCSRT